MINDEMAIIQTKKNIPNQHYNEYITIKSKQ